MSVTVRMLYNSVTTKIAKINIMNITKMEKYQNRNCNTGSVTDATTKQSVSVEFPKINIVNIFELHNNIESINSRSNDESGASVSRRENKYREYCKINHDRLRSVTNEMTNRVRVKLSECKYHEMKYNTESVTVKIVT